MATLAYETVCSAPKEAGSGDPDKQTALIVHGLLGSGYGHLSCYLVSETVSWYLICRNYEAKECISKFRQSTLHRCRRNWRTFSRMLANEAASVSGRYVCTPHAVHEHLPVMPSCYMDPQDPLCQVI